MFNATTTSAFAPVIPPTAADDAALLTALIASDPRAWRTFNERYSRLIHGCIRRVIGSFRGVVDTDAADDIYASFAVQLLANDKRKLRSFEADRGTRLGSWIGMLAIRCAYDYLRTVKREPRRNNLTETEHLRCSAPDAFELYSDREQAQLVERLIADLSPKDRQFVSLYYGEGLDTDTIAKRMRISSKTVYSKKHKIRGRLETLLSQSSSAAA